MAPPRNHAIACFALLVSGAASAQNVSVAFDPTQPGSAIPEELNGLSYEMVEVLPANGTHDFRADNLPLIGMFQSLGVRTLRLGGNTSDTDAIPAAADLDSLFAFAEAAGVRVVFTLKLETFDAGAAATTATYVMAHYANDVICFANGNEPNAYYSTFASYSAAVAQYIAAVTAPGAAPSALFCGPGETSNGTDWVPGFIAAFHAQEAQSTVHEYPGGDGTTVTSASAACDTLLSPSITTEYQTQHASFVPVAADAGLPSRIEETNSFFNGGANGASNAYASALWALDYLYFWAGNGLAGLNFHTSDGASPPYYAVFVGDDAGYAVRPIAYGIKAFALGGHGQLLPVTITNPGNVNLTAYAVRGDGGEVYATLVNRTHGASPVSVDVALLPSNGGYASASAWVLAEPSGDVLATSGVTLGGAAIGDDGSWAGTATPLTAVDGGFAFTLPAATAAVVRLVPFEPDGGAEVEDAGRDAGTPQDAGPRPDGGFADAGALDGGQVADGGDLDAGVLDGGRSVSAGDAGPPIPDGGPLGSGAVGSCGCVGGGAESSLPMVFWALFGVRRRRCSSPRP